MKLTDYLLFVASLVPTLALVAAVVISIDAPRTLPAEPGINTSLAHYYAYLERQP